MNDSLLHGILNRLDPQTINGIANQLGTDPHTAQQGIAAALPTLLGALGRNANSEPGAASLHRALDQHAGHDPSALLGQLLGSDGGGGNSGGGMGGLLGSVLGGAMGGGSARPQNPMMSTGMAILGHVLGGRQPQVANGLGRASGMQGSQMTQLLAMLAPIVMAALANRTRQQGLTPQGLGEVLGREVEQTRSASPAANSLLGAVLDRDGDGDVDAADLMQAGSGLLGQLFGGGARR